MKMKMDAKVQVFHGMTVDDLQDVLEQIPDRAEIKIVNHPRDRPFESSYSEIHFHWEV